VVARRRSRLRVQEAKVNASLCTIVVRPYRPSPPRHISISSRRVLKGVVPGMHLCSSLRWSMRDGDYR
jgi:hypothetical protein